MAKKLEYQIGVDATQGISGVKNFSRTVQQELKNVEGDFDDTATAGEKVATVLSAMARDLDSELGRAATAADALKQALGEDLAGRADIGQIVGDLQRMGLTFEDITTDADKLAASLKEMDQVQMKGIDSGLGGVKTKFGEIDDSVRGSRSVLANMIGNATQDLGALSGVAGSAGVAIGQMGEYMADAALNGQGLKSVVGDFVKVAGPVAGLAVAVAGISAVMGEMNRESKEAAERTKALGDAMENTSSDSLAFAEVLRDDEKALRNFTAATNDPLGTFGVGVDKVLEKVPLIGGVFNDAEQDIIDASSRAGLSIYDLSKQIDNGAKVGGEFTDQLLAALKAGRITEKEFNAINEALLKYADAADKAREATKLFNVDQAEANEILKDLNKQQDPFSVMTKQWQILWNDMADGAINTKEAADAANQLAKNLGKTPEEIETIAKAALDKYMQDTADAGEAYNQSMDDVATLVAGDLRQGVLDLADGMQAFAEASRSVDWQTSEVKGAVSAWDEITSQRFGLDTIFKNTEDAWHGLADALTNENDKIRLSMDLTTERGRAINDALQELAQQTVPQVAAAVKASGGNWRDFREDMEALRLKTIARLMDDFHLAADDAEALAEKIVGTTGDWKATYELSGVEEAKAKLDLLSTAIDDLPDEVTTAVVQEIETGDYKGALKLVQDYYAEHAVILKIIPVVQDVVGGLGLGLGVGGTAATAGPAARGAVAVAPALAPVHVPVQVSATGGGGTTYNVNVALNAGTIGAPFDVMTAVDTAMRRAARLLPAVR